MKYLCCVLLAASCFAKDLGVCAETFPVAEESLIAFFQKQANATQFDMNKYTEEMAEYVQNPTPIEGIDIARETRVFFFDPTHAVEKDVILPNGHILAKKGDRINPLDQRQFDEELLFLDGSNEKQVAWARTCSPQAKWILVAGSPIALEEQEERPVYFDQYGLLTNRFQIKHTPAKVTQEGNRLRIEETAL